MKTIVLLMCLSLFFCGSAFAGFVFVDGFENYDEGEYPSAGGWYNVLGLDGTSALISTDYAYTGSKSFRLEGGAIPRIDAIGIAAQNLITFKCAIYIIEEDGFVFISLADCGVSDGSCAGFYFKNGEILAGINLDNSIGVGTYTTNTWYQVKAVCNFQTQTMDVYINDSLEASDIPIGDENVNCFLIGTQNGAAYFDDVKSVASFTFADGFENYDEGEYPSAGGWYNVLGLDGTSALISTDYAYTGSKSFRLEGGAIPRIDAIGIAAQNFINFECAVYIIEEDGFVFISLADCDVAEGSCAGFYFKNGEIRAGINLDNSIGVGTYTTNTWYQVKAVCNFQTQTMDVYINDYLEASDIPIGNENVNCFLIGMQNGAAYFDDVKSVDGDVDGDGILDEEDNCTDAPNGPDGGICIRGNIGEFCMSNGDCGEYGFCSMDQEDFNENGIGDVCDKPFIKVESPAGGDQWGVGTQQQIVWKSAGVTGNVKIEIGRHDGCWIYWPYIAGNTENDGIYVWTVERPVEDYCMIQISSVNNWRIRDRSEYFDITGNRPPSVPTITFNKNPISPGDSLEFCARSTDPEGHAITYHWQIVVPGDEDQVINTDQECTISGEFNAIGKYTFWCRAKDELGEYSGVRGKTLTVGWITVIQPQAGEDLQIGDNYTIEWESSGIDGEQVSIQFCYNVPVCAESCVFVPGGENTENDGEHSWTVPGPARHYNIIKIASDEHLDIYGESGLFDIVP